MGNDFDYVTYLPGSYTTIEAIAVNEQGAASIVGQVYMYNNEVFPTTPGAFDDTYGGNNYGPNVGNGDAYIVRFNPDGSGVEYVSFLGTDHHDRGND